MALSEGIKGFVNFLTKSFNDEQSERDAFMLGDDQEGSYDPDIDGTLALDAMYGTKVSKPERSFERESKVVSHPNAYKSGEVTVIEPRSFSESAQVVKKLIEKKTIILHLDLLDKEQSQRTIDFVCGATHALSGTAQKISDAVFIFTPSNVSLSVENNATQNKFSESLWNKPL
ncbi:MAG: cell division protein SepF [bacterium]|nr:cell division protein SepF [bacterium]